MNPVDPVVAARLRRRYPPPRVPRLVKTGLVTVFVAGAVGWLLWTATIHSRPPVAGQITSYVAAATSIDVIFTVDRREPSRPVSCHVVAQAADFQVVGESDVPVEASEVRLVDVTTTVQTVRRAVSASVKGCTLV